MGDQRKAFGWGALSRRQSPPWAGEGAGKPFIVRASSLGGRGLRWYRFKSQVWSQVVPVCAFLAAVGTLMCFRGGPYLAAGVLVDLVAAWLLLAGQGGNARDRGDLLRPEPAHHVGVLVPALHRQDRDQAGLRHDQRARIRAGSAQQMTWNVARVGSAA